MTRKKSNVKALALAVTCAILAGGYSGLNPVYAAAPVYHDVVKYDSANQTLDYEYNAGGGIGTAAIQKIKFGNVVLDGSDSASPIITVGSGTRLTDGKIIAKNGLYVGSSTANDGTGSYFSVGDSDGSISAAGNKFMVSGAGAITASSLKLTGTNGTEDVGKAIKDNTTNIASNTTNIASNKANINSLDGKIDSVNTNIRSDMANEVSTINTKIDTKLDTSTFGAYTASNDAAVNELKNKTQNIKVAKDAIVTSSDATYIDGITHAGGVSLAEKKVRAEELVLDEVFTNGTSAEARLTREGLAALNSMVYDEHDKINIVDGKPVIQAGNGSVVGGVKFDNKNITNVDSVMVNKDATNQVQINSEGIVVGLTSAVINGDGFYAGGHNYNDAKAAIDGVNGKIKGADGKFGVDDQGNVTTTGNIQGQDITVNGRLNAKGDAVVSGDLSVAGKADFTKEATFSGGIKTDGIYEATADKGVTVDGVLLKDKGIDAADSKFTVNGATGDTTVGGKLDVTGNIQGADITATGALNGDSLNVTKNATVGGTLGVTGDISTNGSVTAKGGLSAANGNFTVDGTTGDTTLKGKLDVTGDTTLKGKLDVTGKATLKDELQVDKKATFGSAAGSQTVINGGDITADGQLNAKSARIGGVNGVGISDSGVITGVTKLTTKALEVTDDLVVSGDITGAALKGTSLAITGNGTITGDLGVTGAITGATINGATITTNSFNGATIGATTFNGVTLTTDGDVSGRNMTASGTVTGTKITDGAGASMNAGTVKGTTITDGSGFTATGGNVSAKDVTATGTVKGTTVTDGVAKMSGGKVTAQNGVEVDANNYLNSSGLKTSNIDASKATIGKIKIEGSKITSTEADETVGIAGITVNNAGALNNVTSIDGVAVSGSAASGLTVGAGATAVTIGGNSLALSSTNFNVDDDGDVIGQSFTSGASHLKDGELKLNAANIWNTTEGIKAEKAVIGANTLDAAGISTTGTLGVKGQATFGDSTSGNYTTVNGGKVDITANGGTTTIEGAKITTKTLDVEDIILRNEMKDGTGATINIKGSDGSMSVASGKFAVDKDGQLTNKMTGIASGFGYETQLETSKSGIKANYTNAINGNQNIIDMGASGISIGVSGTTPSVGAGFKAELDAATMGYGTANSIVVNKDTIKSALGTDVTRVMTSNATEKSIVDKVGAASRSLTADEIIDAAGGMTITTNNTGTTFSNGTNNTLINGSNLTLKNGANKTELTAGGATFTGAAGRSATAGTETTIDGGVITTDTLNVKRIELGEKLVDSATGETITNSKIYLNNDGSFGAAKGAFQIDTEGQVTNEIIATGTTGTDASKTTFTSSKTGITAKYRKGTGTATSGLTIEDNHAALNASGGAALDLKDKTAKIGSGTDSLTTYTSDTIESKVGDTTVETKDGSFSVKGNAGNGMNIDTNTGKTTFTGSDYNGGASGTTTIDGNTITTGKLVTDELVIKGNGSGNAEGLDPHDPDYRGSIAFGGNGSITSNSKDTTNEATFKTDEKGTFTEAKDIAGNKTTNTVNAQGNTNVVTDGTNTSTATQTATSIGGVVTNGDVTIGAVTMKQELTVDGVKFEQTLRDETGHDEVKIVEIADGDVTVTNNRNTTDPQYANQTVHLSDLGSLNNLDGELAARDEYKNNQTAVGAINAEAGIRREEVARLDNRIDDVNNRVDKVGAMAAAIASLKSIGYDPQAPSEFSIGLGQYKGETGVAMGFFHYPNKNFMINVSLSTAGGETMGGIGATWRFGHKSPQKLLDEQREAQARKELAAAEKYQAAAKLAKEAQERAEYAAKLARQAQVSADNAKAAADATQAKHFQ